MLLIFMREMLESEIFTGKQFDAFYISAVLTDFSICLSAVFYVLMGVVPAAKIRKGGKNGE